MKLLHRGNGQVYVQGREDVEEPDRDSETGADFTAMMYSVAGTLAINGIDVRRCSMNG